jgi:16S rRNA (cytidine1402-2'-O)-methyltransferase
LTCSTGKFIIFEKRIIVNGKLYLIPVTLGNEDFQQVIPEKVLTITRSLRHFIVEDLRSARRFLRMIDKKFPIDDSVFHELSEHTAEAEISGYLDAVLQGSDAGVMSEAGLPCLADPGSLIVSLAHRKNIEVIPLSGPSSIILALIASGFNGQNFTFNGYLPVRQPELSARLKELEKKALQGYTQIFMETPYRNQKMLQAVLSSCSDDMMLCIAENITLPQQSIKTKKIREWKKEVPTLTDKLVVFVMK